MQALFTPHHGASWAGFVLISLVICSLILAAMQLVPTPSRKYVIQGITFLGGLYFALEFFLPTQKTKAFENGANLLTPSLDGVTNWLLVVATFTVGLGVINLSIVHGKRLTKGGNTAFNSGVFFVSMFVMLIIDLLHNMHPNSINKNLFEILFTGALTTLDATMFSIIAFYIVSAAYRAFRVRSTEATILLVTAVIVMLGQIAIGQLLTHKFGNSNFHVETIRDWILTQANTASVRAIGFGLGIGGLAVALRIWLSLERGSYFDSQS